MPLSGEKKGIRESRLFKGEFRGENRQSDAAAIDDMQFRLLENLRVHQGRLVSRGGQDRQHPDADDGAWNGFHDAGDVGAPSSDPV